MARLPENDWRHSALACALLAGVLVLLYLVMVQPAVKARAEFRERYADLQFQFARFSRTANQMDTVKQELVRLAGTDLDSAGFLEAGAGEVAAANLQKQIQSLIEDSGGVLTSIQALQDESGALFPAVTVKVQMRASLDALLAVLRSLREGQPVLLVNNLYLQGRGASRAGGARLRGSVQASGLIDARMEITGYIFQENAS